MVGNPDFDLWFGNVIDTVEGLVIGVKRWVSCEFRINRLVADFAFLPAQVLAQRPCVIQVPRELRRQGCLVTVVFVEPWLAGEPVAVDPAIWRIPDGTFVWEELRGGAAVIALDVGHDGPVDIFVGAPGQRWHQHLAVVFDMINLGVAVALDRHQPVQQRALRVQGSGGVDGDLLAVVIAVLQLQFGVLFGFGAFADLVDQAAHRALPIQHRRRTLEHFKAFQGEGVGAHVGVSAEALL